MNDNRCLRFVTMETEKTSPSHSVGVVQTDSLGQNLYSDRRETVSAKGGALTSRLAHDNVH